MILPQDKNDQNETRIGKALKFLSIEHQSQGQGQDQHQSQVGSNSENPTKAWTFYKSLIIGLVLTFV